MNELRPSRDLLDPTFNGYKLSLAAVPVHKLEFVESVDIVEPTEDQYSFLHQREFSLHNHLHSDTWNPLNVYFIDQSWAVNKININQTSGRPDGINSVYSIPKLDERSGGEFNISLLFPSEDLVVIGDGFKNLHIIDSKCRSESSSQWKLLHSEKIFDESRPFHVVDSCRCDDGSRRLLHCVLLHVEPKHDHEFQADKKENKNASKYETVLQWITFKSEEEEEGEEKEEGKRCSMWRLEKNEEVRGSGQLEYVALEEGGSALYLASQHRFNFTTHSSHNNNHHHGDSDTTPTHHVENGKEKVDYRWRQSFDEITLVFEGVESADGVSVTVNHKSVVVKHCDTVLLAGTLVRHVSSELTTWTLNQSRLEIVLQKSECGTMWHKLMADAKCKDDKVFIGKEMMDGEMAEEISGRLTHLTSDTQESAGSGVINDWLLEDCDAFQEESTTLFRFTPDSPDPTHQVHVGGAQWLMSLRTGEGCGGVPPSVCIRSDVDGCVWKPCRPHDDASPWPITHIGTFLAFGYILASKVNRKFTVAPPDLSYVSVVDNTGHVIIYRQGVAVGGELRNRKTHRHVQSIATQSMVNLQTRQSVLGAVATPLYLFILTTNHLHLVHIL